MSVDPLSIALLVISFILSAFYSASEAALISITPERTRQLIKRGGRRGRALHFWANHSHVVLTTILVGNNVVNIFIASLITTIASRALGSEALAVSVGVSTLLLLIFGEIIPKTFARAKAEQFAYFMLTVLKANFYLMYPVIMGVSWFIKKILGKSIEPKSRAITKFDIEYMVNKAEEDKTIDSKQLDLLTSILEFPTIKVKDIMVPRKDVASIPKDINFDRLVSFIQEDNYTRYPVVENDGDLDSTIGFFHVKDMIFFKEKDRKNFSVMRRLKTPFFVYEHMKIQAVFDHMNKRKLHLALVKDENGLVVGIITLEDIMEQIVGEIQDEHDAEVDAVLKKKNWRQDGKEGLTLDGDFSLRDLYNEFDIKIPLNDNYSSLRGFLLDKLGNNFPKKGNIIYWEGLSFELIEVANNEIMKVKITDVENERSFHKRESDKAYPETAS